MRPQTRAVLTEIQQLGKDGVTTYQKELANGMDEHSATMLTQESADIQLGSAANSATAATWLLEGSFFRVRNHWHYVLNDWSGAGAAAASIAAAASVLRE